MKKIVSAGLALLLALTVLAGCNTDKEPESSEVTSSESSSEPSSSEPVSYTAAEAASRNAQIQDSDIDLVQAISPVTGSQKAVIKTNYGELEIYLYDKLAPKAVENFVTHAKAGYYNGLTFDKVLNNFIVEGGDPDGKGGNSVFTGEDGKPELFEDEYSLNLWHFRGAVSMSHADGREGNGSRFFIVQAPFVDDDTLDSMKAANYPDKVREHYETVGGTPGFDWNRTVFGMVAEDSLAVLDAIARVEVDEDGLPVESVLIESIAVSTVNAAPASSSGSESAESSGSSSSGSAADSSSSSQAS